MEATKLIRFYTITSELGNMIYVGSTENTLECRYNNHTRHTSKIKSMHTHFRNSLMGQDHTIVWNTKVLAEAKIIRQTTGP